MSLSRELLLCCLLLIVMGCSKSTPPRSSTATVPPVPTTSPASSARGGEASRNIDACALLTSKDLQAIQGEALKENKPSTRADGGFLISQCLFTLPTFANSISLLVAQRGESAGARDPKEFWQETFHRAEEEAQEKEAKEKEKEKDKDNNKERDQAKKQGSSEEEERGALPEKIDGVGDEAYWTGNRVGGALYVLKGNIYIRVSLGGPGDQATKIKKAKALAQIILKRL